jgi:release factor glutamine methyltransferase
MGVNIQTIIDIRFYLAKELDKIYQEPEKNAIINIIIKTVLGISGLQGLYLSEKPVSVEQAEKITEICKELLTGKPVQYVMGETIFYDCIIKVNTAVLIPRSETEELVDLVIRENRDFAGNILDIGTGSGCIAIALGTHLPGSIITGIDISGDAIRLAKENALLNNVAVSFVETDIFNLNNEAINKADIVVSNPPYVRILEKQLMSRNVLDFEPHTALFVPDNDPLLYYKAILKVADKILSTGGKIYFEINETMGRQMVQLLKSYGLSDTEVIKDINNKDRIIKGTRDA